MLVTDWLDDAVQQTREKYQVQRALEEKLAQEEALKARLAGEFCEELFAWLETIDVKFNTRFGGQVLAVSPIGTNDDRGVQVLARPIRAQAKMAVLRYQKETKSIGLSMDCGPSKLPPEIRLVLSAEGPIKAEIDAEYYAPEQLGRRIINNLLDIDLMGQVSRLRSPEQPSCSVPCNNIEMPVRTVVASGSNGGCAAGMA